MPCSHMDLCFCLDSSNYLDGYILLWLSVSLAWLGLVCLVDLNGTAWRGVGWLLPNCWMMMKLGKREKENDTS